MSFNDIPQNLADQIAEPVKAFLIRQYGKTGLKLESEIRSNVQWRPTIQVKTSPFTLLGIEVSDILYPAAIKVAAHDLSANCSDMPVCICVACSLIEYQSDHRQTLVNQLRRDGIGLITVDDIGNVVEQFPPVPVIHHIHEDQLADRMDGLPNRIKVKIREAYKVYRTNSYQGLQDAGQLIEALIMGFAADCHKNGWIAAKSNNSAAALDELYASQTQRVSAHRAAIGGARDFMRNFRNLGSHPAKNTTEAAKLIRDCREGFITALRITNNLYAAINQCNLKPRLLMP